jgi:glucan-binding YG repeat protein
MKIYIKILLDKNNNLLEEKFYDYSGGIASAMGIHYTYGANKGNKLMEKQAKKEKRLAEKKAKKAERLAKEGIKEEETKEKAIDTSTPLSLEAITNPDKE